MLEQTVNDQFCKKKAAQQRLAPDASPHAALRAPTTLAARAGEAQRWVASVSWSYRIIINTLLKGELSCKKNILSSGLPAWALS